jgi:hypothetical protein
MDLVFAGGKKTGSAERSFARTLPGWLDAGWVGLLGLLSLFVQDQLSVLRQAEAVHLALVKDLHFIATTEQFIGSDRAGPGEVQRL